VIVSKVPILDQAPATTNTGRFSDFAPKRFPAGSTDAGSTGPDPPRPGLPTAASAGRGPSAAGTSAGSIFEHTTRRCTRRCSRRGLVIAGGDQLGEDLVELDVDAFRTSFRFCGMTDGGGRPELSEFSASSRPRIVSGVTLSRPLDGRR